MNSNRSSAAEWIGCRVVFGATRDGHRVDNIEVAGALACFDRNKDLGEQAGAAVADWLSRQERVHGYLYSDPLITYIEVQSDEGRYLDATKLGWCVLDDSRRRKAIEQVLRG